MKKISLNIILLIILTSCTTQKTNNCRLDVKEQTGNIVTKRMVCE